MSQRTSRVIGFPDFVLEVQMPLHSKARPRMTRSGHAYMAPAYKAAQEEMRRLLREQWPHEPLEGPLALELEVWGEGRGDADNIAGFLMDAAGPHRGAPGVLWNDDRVSVISALSIRWHKAPKKDSRWVVRITLLDGPLQ